MDKAAEREDKSIESQCLASEVFAGAQRLILDLMRWSPSEHSRGGQTKMRGSRKTASSGQRSLNEVGTSHESESLSFRGVRRTVRCRKETRRETSLGV